MQNKVTPIGRARTIVQVCRVMDPYMQSNMNNYMQELRRLFPEMDHDEDGSRGTAAGSRAECLSSSTDSTSPEGPFPQRRPDTPYWPRPPGLEDLPPWNSQAERYGRPANSLSPEGADMNIIRRPGSTTTWKPQPLRKITKTYASTPSPQEYYGSTFAQVPVTPKRFSGSMTHSSPYQFDSSPEFHITQSPLSPERYYGCAQSPMSARTLYPEYHRSPVPVNYGVNWSNKMDDNTSFTLTPRSSLSWCDRQTANDSFQSVNSSYPLTPHRAMSSMSNSDLLITNTKNAASHQGTHSFPQESIAPIGLPTPPEQWLECTPTSGSAQERRLLEIQKMVQTNHSSSITEPIRSDLIVALEPNKKTKNYCHFCRKNGESPHVYWGHPLKVKKSKKTVVACPILRSLICPICGASGDNAHTSTYCPVVLSSNDGKRLPSTTVAIKNTRFKSNGKPRY